MKFERSDTTFSLACATLVVLMLCSASAVFAQGGDPNTCDAPGDEPDVIVGSIHQMQKYGTVGDITAFAIGTTSCNIGTCWLNWLSGSSNQHPTIGQNMLRLKDGRFEHIGQAWLKHGFFALSGNVCSNSCIGVPNGAHLGVNCSDPYSSSLNGQQNGMGPKFEVNAATGFHPHPVTNLGNTGNAIYKRLQVRNSDLDPALNAGATYWVEAQYIAEDDAGAGNSANNASYRQILVTGSSGNFNAALTGPTERESPGMVAWSDFDPTVAVINLDVTGDGRFILGYKVTDIGGGMWHYEYAVQNLTSHRSARTFSIEVPIGGTLENIGFHDVDYHSGEPFDNTDWTHNNGAGGVLTWTNGATFDQNPNANALRWGTMYNFRFDSDAPPGTNQMTMEIFRPGTPTTIGKPIAGPLLCDNDGFCDSGENCTRCPDDCANDICDPGEDPCNCPADCDLPSNVEPDCGDGIDNDCDGAVDCADSDCCLVGGCTSPDADGDGTFACQDCNDSNTDAWDTPTEVLNLVVDKAGTSTALSWDPPAQPGGNLVEYRVLRARVPDNFMTNTTCLTPPQVTDTDMIDTQNPTFGNGFYFLVRPINSCPLGEGSLGTGENGVEREGRSCP